MSELIHRRHDALGSWGWDDPPNIPPPAIPPTLPAPEPEPDRPQNDQITLEVWTLHGAVDDLCTQYEGTIWEQGTGPMPVADTHPNCKCTRDFHSSY